MVRIADADWSGLLSPQEKPVELLLRKGVAVYIRVRRGDQAVYRHHRVDITQDEVVWSLPQAGIVPDAAFVQLDDASLADLAVCGRTDVSKFSGTVLALSRPHDVVGLGRGGYPIRTPRRIEAADLVRLECDYAVIIDQRQLNAICAVVPPLYAPSPEAFAVQISVLEGDLYVTSADFNALRQVASEQLEVVPFPFDELRHMSGIYWMFQAAFALVKMRTIDADSIVSWLRKRSNDDTFSGKRGDFSAKLVLPAVSRTRGRKRGARPFKISNLKDWVDGLERFQFPFVSDGLTVALVVADWWVALLERDPDESKLTLATKLYAENFDEVETAHLVRLIAGVPLSTDEKVTFKAWAREQDRRSTLAAARDRRLEM